MMQGTIIFSNRSARFSWKSFMEQLTSFWRFQTLAFKRKAYKHYCRPLWMWLFAGQCNTLTFSLVFLLTRSRLVIFVRQLYKIFKLLKQLLSIFPYDWHEMKIEIIFCSPFSPQAWLCQQKWQVIKTAYSAFGRFIAPDISNTSRYQAPWSYVHISA